MDIMASPSTKEYMVKMVVEYMDEQENFPLQQKGKHATLEEHQQALYYLLCEFDRVCQKIGVTYYLFAGTLLGAVRHHGFVPWDDDLDVLMHRNDYEYFLSEAPKFLEKEFFLQKEFSEHYPMFFSKLRLNGTTCLEKYYPKDPLVHQGVYMDIFPLDNACNSKIGRYIQFLCSKVVIAKGLDAEGFATSNLLKKAVMIISRVFPGSIFHRIVRGPAKQEKYVHCFLGAASKYSKSIFRAEQFEECMLMRFKDRAFSAPKQYDSILTVLYGDYMKVPPEGERKYKKHALLVDLTKSYEHYKTYRDGLKFDVYTRSIR